MKATRLYILNYDDDENITKIACNLLSFGNKLVRVSCGDEVVDEGCVVEALFEMCISELEFIVCGNFDDVVGELGHILVDMGYDVDMEFVVEVEDGYVYLTPQDVKRVELDEEEYEEAVV